MFSVSCQQLKFPAGTQNMIIVKLWRDQGSLLVPDFFPACSLDSASPSILDATETSTTNASPWPFSHNPLAKE